MTQILRLVPRAKTSAWPRSLLQIGVRAYMAFLTGLLVLIAGSLVLTIALYLLGA